MVCKLYFNEALRNRINNPRLSYPNGPNLFPNFCSPYIDCTSPYITVSCNFIFDNQPAWKILPIILSLNNLIFLNLVQESSQSTNFYFTPQLKYQQLSLYLRHIVTHTLSLCFSLHLPFYFLDYRNKGMCLIYLCVCPQRLAHTEAFW